MPCIVRCSLIQGSNAVPPEASLEVTKQAMIEKHMGFPVFDLGFAKIGVDVGYHRHFPEGAWRGVEVRTQRSSQRISSALRVLCGFFSVISV